LNTTHHHRELLPKLNRAVKEAKKIYFKSQSFSSLYFRNLNKFNKEKICLLKIFEIINEKKFNQENNFLKKK
jgi:hypothetical protein